MAQVDCYTGRRWTVGEAGGRTPLISAVALLNYIACSTECQFDFGWGWVRSWGRRLGVSISDSSWSWVVGLLMSGGGPRRTATSTSLSTKGREGPRRTATATPFSTKGREELQRQHLYPRRATENCNCNTFVRGGPRRHAENCNVNIFIHEGPRRTTENCNCNTFFHEVPRRTPLVFLGRFVYARRAGI